MWAYFFKPPPTLEERLGEIKKGLRATLRETEREIKRLEKTEKVLLRKIRQAAENQQTERGKTICKNLVRHRGAIRSLYKVTTQIESTMLHLQMVKTTTMLSNTMKQMYRVMFITNRQCNLPEMQKILMELEKETEIMDMKQELMDDATDSMLQADGDEEEENRIYESVLDEIGVQTVEKMADVPLNSNNTTFEVDPDLQNRINDLRK